MYRMVSFMYVITHDSHNRHQHISSTHSSAITFANYFVIITTSGHYYTNANVIAIPVTISPNDIGSTFNFTTTNICTDNSVTNNISTYNITGSPVRGTAIFSAHIIGRISICFVLGSPDHGANQCIGNFRISERYR